MLRRLAVIFCLVLAPLCGARAEPLRVTLVSGYAAGSLTTHVAEIAAHAFEGQGQSAEVQIVTGRSGLRAAEAVASGKPDGSVVLVTELLNLALLERSQPRLRTELVPVAMLSKGFSAALFVSVNSPIRTWADFVAAARSRTLKQATTTSASAFSMPLRVIERQIGASFEDVESDGTLGLADLVTSGKADFAFTTTELVRLSEGRLRVILTTGAERSETYSFAPTLAEVTGNRKLAFTLSYGVLAPRKTSPEAIRRLAAALATLRKNEDARSLARSRNFPLLVSNASTMAEALARQRRVSARMELAD